jgi:diguanylate cyclase (GGDEF)-like protein
LFKSLTLSQLLFSMFGLILSIQIVIILVIINVEKDSDEQEKWVTFTYEVMSQSASYMGHLIDAETGQRGYLLTGKSEYLEPYYAGRTLTKQHFLNLRELITNNPSQQLILSEIEKLMNTKLTEMHKTITLRENNKLEEALAILDSNSGKMKMDSIRKLKHEFTRENEHLLTERRKAYAESQQSLNLLFFLASFVLLTIILFVALVFKVRIVEPIVALTEEIQDKTLHDSSFSPSTVTSDEIVRLKLVFREMYEQIKEKTSKLNKLSMTDSLTGLYNRRAFDKRVGPSRLHCIRYKRCFSIMMLDIDHFKQANDKYGHEIGDVVLKMVTVAISSQLREVDVLARFGGEEFAIALPETSLDEAVQVAERIRKDVEKVKIEEGSNLVGVTISIGITEISDAGEDLQDMLKTADELLYKAKQNGRNRVEA